MTENQGNRPEENSASVPPVPPLPSPAAASGAAPSGGARPAPPSGSAYPQHGARADTGAYTTPTQPYPPQGFGAPVTAPTRPAEKKSGTGRFVGLLVAAALVGGAGGVGATWAGANLWGPADASSTSSGPQVVTVNNPDSVNATAAIATKVVPSVVTINVSSGQNGGTGSGVVLSADGYVLTNTHVVTLDGESGDPSISVTTSDGHIYSASIVGTDPVYDLAVIKLEGASGLTPVTWGDSSNLNVGDQTVAIGAPLGLSNTVTTGIVSALNRSIEIASSAAPDSGQGDQEDQGEQGDNPFFFDFGQGQQSTQPTETIKIAVIQTDAPINPGNSGGALVNNKGELVGINVAIASAGSTSSSDQSGSIGVGFSIPSDIAHRVADDLMKNGKTTHGLLGATVRDAAGVQGSTITGAYIVDVTAGGGAADGGLKAGDVVTKFNGVPITGAVDLTAQVRALATGSTADVTYVRDGKTATTTVTLGTLGG